MNNLRKQFSALEAEMNEVLVERQDEIRLAMAGMLTGNHLFLLGPPGTAKSLLCDALVNRIGDGEVYKHLITKTTTDDEVFGPISMAAMQRDISRRATKVTDDETGMTHCYLPSSNVFFLDEIFKGSSVLLNGLLNILNEGIYANGAQVMDVDVKICVSASNETPGSDLDALYDRFLLRSLVDYVNDPAAMLHVMNNDTRGADDVSATITQATLEAAKAEVKKVKVSNELLRTALNVALLARSQGMQVSDRRIHKLVNVYQANAWLEGRDEAVKADLILPLASALWRDAEQVETARGLVEDTLVPALKTAREGLSAIRLARRKFDEASTGGDASVSMERAKALVEVSATIKEMTIHRDEAAADEQVLIDNIIDEATNIHSGMVTGVKA
tara:strand:- start:3312 stop:4475 length:1164 start_codon:yes stop_codon:yes gene_type:complete